MEKLQAAFAKAPAVVRKHASLAVGFSALKIANRARALAPEATGLLKRSITSDHDNGALSAGVGIGSAAAFYWRFVEFGTVHMSAQPFFRPAAEEGQAEFVREIARIGPDVEADLKER